MDVQEFYNRIYEYPIIINTTHINTGAAAIPIMHGSIPPFSCAALLSLSVYLHTASAFLSRRQHNQCK